MQVRLMKAFRGRAAGDVHEYPDDQAAKLIESGIAVAVDGDPSTKNTRESSRKGKSK